MCNQCAIPGQRNNLAQQAYGCLEFLYAKQERARPMPSMRLWTMSLRKESGYANGIADMDASGTMAGVGQDQSCFAPVHNLYLFQRPAATENSINLRNRAY